MQKTVINETRTRPMSLRCVSCHLCLGLPSCLTFPSDALNVLLIQPDTDCFTVFTLVRATCPSHLMRLSYVHSNRTTFILTKSNTKGDGRSSCSEFCTRDQFLLWTLRQHFLTTSVRNGPVGSKFERVSFGPRIAKNLKPVGHLRKINARIAIMITHGHEFLSEREKPT